MPAHASASDWEPIGKARPASSIARSSERRHLEEAALVKAMRDEIDHCRRRGQWQRLECIELLFARGWPNKAVADKLCVKEQIVANYKFEFVTKLRATIRAQGLSEEVFPELYQ